MPKRKTTEQFIKEAKIIHNDKYDYSLVEYLNNSTKIKIICSVHGIFEQRPNDHLDGCGCPFCNKKFKRTKNQFINEARLIHGNKYDYSLVEYIDNISKVEIICPIHGSFFQKPVKHLNRKYGCRLCGIEKRSKASILTTKQFIEKAKIIHGNKYDYSLVEYKNNLTKVKIICKDHGIFEQRPNDHLMGHGCKICKESFGERDIRNFLLENNIKFEVQKTFKNCRNVLPLAFDFYLSDYNILIEYQGGQHFKSVKWFGGEEGFKKQQERDKIKKEFCQNNNITLLEIGYDEDITKKLKEILN